VLPNPALTDKLIAVIKREFKDGAVTLSLKDPGANMRKKMNKVAIINSWVHSDNEHVTLDPNNMGPTANLTRSQVLAAGLRKYGDGVDKTRVCLSLAYNGLMVMSYLDIDNPSPPPLIIDLVPAHTQTEFNKKSGSARIDASNTDAAELIIYHVFTAYNYAFIEGWDNIKLIKMVIQKLGLVSIFLSDKVISGLIIDDYQSPRARYNLEVLSQSFLSSIERRRKPPSFLHACKLLRQLVAQRAPTERVARCIC
jgi:hypothetical protein